MTTGHLTPDPALFLNNPSVTKSQLNTAFGQNMDVANLAQGAMAATAGVITSAGTPTENGNAAYNDEGVANGADGTLLIYDASLGRTRGVPWRNSVWASLPATGGVDERYYVTDLQVVVSYRDATADAVLSGGSGLAGWHPITPGFLLVENATGSTITARRSVAYAGVAVTRQVTPTTVAKQQNVLGVAIIDIPTGQSGIIATASSGVVVGIYCNVTIGAVAAGDLIATSEADGECHTVGPAPASPFSAATQSATGTPCGAFAVALEDAAVAGVVPCRMLGYVGQGCHTTRTIAQCYEDLTPVTGGTLTNFFPLRSRTNDNGGQAATNDLLLDAKHGIPISVDIQFTLTVDSGTSGLVVVLDYSKDGTNIERRQGVKRYSGDDLEAVLESVQVPLKSDGSLYYGYTPSAAISSTTTWTFFICGYTY